MPLNPVKNLLLWFLTPQHFADRRVQTCAVILFGMGMIAWCKTSVPPDPLDTTIVDWSYILILAAIGIYHAARGVNDWIEKKSPVEQ